MYENGDDWIYRRLTGIEVALMTPNKTLQFKKVFKKYQI
jgi:hypothetical protein